MFALMNRTAANRGLCRIARLTATKNVSKICSALLSLIVVCALLDVKIWAQSSLTSFQAQALLALTPTHSVAHSVTMTGTVDRVVGSMKESGSVQLKSNDSGLESENWTLPSGDRVLTKTELTGKRTCSHTVAAKVIDEGTSLECWRAVPWFAPSTSLLETNNGLSLATDVPTKEGSDVGLVRMRFVPDYGDTTKFSAKAQQSVAKLLQTLATDVVYDGSSALPKRLEYTQQTNGDPAAAIHIKVEYSDFRMESGLMLPHHIQRYIQHALESDIHITNVTVE